MTLFQTNSALAWPRSVDSTLSPYQASSNELVLVDDPDGLAVVVLMPDADEDGIVVAVKNVSAIPQSITLTTAAGVFCDGDVNSGADVLLADIPGTAAILRVSFDDSHVGPHHDSIWHIL